MFHKDALAVGSVADDEFVRTWTEDQLLRFAGAGRIKPSLAGFHFAHENVLAVGCDGCTDYALRSKGAGRSTLDVHEIGARGVSGFRGRKNNRLAVGHPAGAVVIELVVGKLPGFANSSGQQDQLSWGSH